MFIYPQRGQNGDPPITNEKGLPATHPDESKEHHAESPCQNLFWFMETTFIFIFSKFDPMGQGNVFINFI